MRGLFFALGLLAACGGGAVAPVFLATQVPELAASAPAPVAAPGAASGGAASPTPAPVSPAPEVVSPAWTANWTAVLEESWGALKLGGWIWQEHKACTGGLADPGSGDVRRFGVDATGWALASGDRGHLQTGPAGLTIESAQQQGGGIALLSGLDLDPARPIRLTGVVDLQPDEGAWLGLAVHNGDGNYREIGPAWFGGVQHLLVHAPCYVVNVGPIDPGPRRLAVEYHPAHGWRMTVDGVERYTEPIDFRGNRLQGQPRAALLAVNLAAESTRGTQGRVRATVAQVQAFQDWSH